MPVCQRDEFLGLHALGPPEGRQPERHRAHHHGHGGICHLHPDDQVREGGGRHAGRDAAAYAGGHAGGELADDLLLVLADVLVHVDHLHGRPLVGHPRGVQLAEVHGSRDDDGPARDGGDGPRDLRAAAGLVLNGQPQAHRPPDDHKAAQEGDAPGDQADDVR